MAWVLDRVASLSPRARRWALACAAGTLALGALYMGWFRDSSLVRVERVTVTGLTTTDAPKVRARLAEAARRMTTLHVDEGRLLRAIGTSTAVSELRVSTDFPHGMRIEVVERPPVAVLVAPGVRIAVAGDGTLLRKVRATDVPSVVITAAPSGSRVSGAQAERLVKVAAAAPAALRPRIGQVRSAPGRGLVAQLRRGPQVIFGDTSALRSKWAAAAAVLADRASRGAAYVDVRLPDRPVAGGLDVPQPEGDEPAPPTPVAPLVPGATAPQAGTDPGAAGAGTPTGAGPGAATPATGTGAAGAAPPPTAGAATGQQAPTGAQVP
jgi:cell division protein FtsQ